MKVKKNSFKLSKEDTEALGQLSLDFQHSAMTPDVSHKIVDALINPALIDQHTDLSMDEIRLLTICKTIGEYFNDEIKLGFVENYIRLKKSNNRTSLTRLEEMVIAKTQDARSWMDRNILSKLGMGREPSSIR
jgi:hypothetical protein